MLRQGGNAIDAAVAVGYAEAVVNPCCGNIGGGGFLTAHLADGRDVFLDFRETAPAAASRGHVPRRRRPAGARRQPGRLEGGRGAGIGAGTGHRAGEVRHLAARHGDGAGDPPGARGLRAQRRRTRTCWRGRGAAAAGPEGGGGVPAPGRLAMQAGDRLVQPDLAATLQAIADKGPDAFYHGRIPQAVEAASRAGGGILTAADFAAYRVAETPPLACSYRGYQVLSAPPPSSGGVTICETPEHPGRLRPARHGVSLGRGGARHDGGAAAGVLRPQHLPRRPGVRAMRR